MKEKSPTMITRLKKLTKYSLLILGILSGYLPAHAQALDEIPQNPGSNLSETSIFTSLSYAELLEITIETDLTELLENRYRDEYQMARLTHVNAGEEEVAYDIKIRPRGKFRRRVCDFPPVKMKCPKRELLQQGYSEHNDLKLVTHCLDEKFEGNENVLKEYLAYKIFNEISAKSFRVQLLKITYKDTSKKYGKIKRYGFLIEDEDEMAERLNGEICECMNQSAEELALKDENLMAIFQYMIGNSDWSTMMARNLKMVQTPEGKVIPVPYDFDFAGLVDADYALPNADYGLVSVKDRAFLGEIVDQKVLGKNLFHFKQKRQAIKKLVQSFKYLSIDSRSEINAYLDSFYENMEELSLLNGTEETTPADVAPAGGNIR